MSGELVSEAAVMVDDAVFWRWCVEFREFLDRERDRLAFTDLRVALGVQAALRTADGDPGAVLWRAQYSSHVLALEFAGVIDGVFDDR